MSTDRKYNARYKDTLDNIIIILYIVDENTSDLKGLVIENVQNQTQREINEQSNSKMWGNFYGFSACVIGALEIGRQKHYFKK